MIDQCLDALMAQTVQPYEIIIVDNNSTDDTVKIAKHYKRVKVVAEPRLGLIEARNAGMVTASGEVIARLDADSRPATGWIAQIQKTFCDSTLKAATGTGDFYDAPFKHFVRTTRNLFAVWLNRLALGHHMLWGSNMAIRRSAWLKIAGDVCIQRDIMEDLDIAAHISKKYGTRAICYDPKIKVDISARRGMVSIKRNWLYLKMWPRTLALHGYQRRILLWPNIALLVAGLAIANKLGRFYNVERDQMVFTLAQWRSNPFYQSDNP